MQYIKLGLRNWHFDIPTLIITVLFLPLLTFFLGILRKHGKEWGGFLIEGICYWVGRAVMHSLAARFSLHRYCRLELQKDNQFLYIPSRTDMKVQIDKTFVNLTLEQKGGLPRSYNQDDIFTAGNRMRIIGDPGSGKSSLIKRLFRNACREAIKHPSKAMLPILVELKNITVPKNISESKLGDWFYNFLKDTVKKSAVFGMETCFENYASVSGLLVLLDGLDEVASPSFQRVQSSILALSERLGSMSSKNVIVLTMRTQLYQQTRENYRENFGTALFVRPFTPSDVYEFLSRFDYSGAQTGPSIYAELADRPTVREMCSNPLVLAMYVAERRSGSDPVTPESRTDFYRRVLDELLLKRRVRQTGSTVAPSKLREQRERILGKLAYDHLLDSAQAANSLQWVNAIQVVRGVMKCTEQRAREVFLDIAKDTGLVAQEKEYETFRFIHLTFCEFLAAFEAVQGQEDGVDQLLEVHEQLRHAKNAHEPSRLLEAIPFACGLVQRARRDAVLSKVAEIGDDRLLARCFLETKAYEHPSWQDFARATRHALLSAPESRWNENWLQELHLFNVVVRDATECAVHIPSPQAQINLGEMYAELVKRQAGSGLSTLLASFASHDAAAAFRLADVCRLDLPADFPEIVTASCDQSAFLSLVTERMLTERNRLSLWASPIANAGLKSGLVAAALVRMPPARGAITSELEKIPKNHRWDVPYLTGISFYSQILSLACWSVRPAPDQVGSGQGLSVSLLKTVPAPGRLLPRMTLLSGRIAAVFVAFGGFLGLVSMATSVVTHQFVPELAHAFRHGTSVAVASMVLSSSIVALGYLIILRSMCVYYFYRSLMNLSEITRAWSAPAGAALILPTSLLATLTWILLSRTERRLLTQVGKTETIEKVRGNLA